MQLKLASYIYTTNIINELKNNKGSKLIMRLEHPFEYII